MVEFKVLITTSGIGSRLGELTNFTNKSLIRVGDKPSLSYIIESYPKNTHFVITLGHFGNHVKQFINLAYPDGNFEFVDIDNYEGPGSSLGYSISKCKDKLMCPFIFHASDTIIKNYEFEFPDKNYLICSDQKDSSQYRTVDVNNGLISIINEKGALNFDYVYVGIAGIKDYQNFFNELDKLLIEKNIERSDADVINSLLKFRQFHLRSVSKKNWFDIGNTFELSRSRESFNSSIEVLDKKDESIFFFDDFVIKFFSNTIINSNRVFRANKLSGLVPEVIDSTENFYKYKKAEGKLFSKSVNSEKFQFFLKWSKQNLWLPRLSNDFKSKCFDFYITKTKKRIEEYLKSNNDVMVINGKEVGSIYDLLSKIDIDWLTDGIPVQFHGDFILDNIIETDEGFCLIDWRQDFANDLEIGDIYYDLSKLNHNLIVNHDIVTKNLFNSESENCHILINSKLMECKGHFDEFVRSNNYDLNKIEIITSLIWINMAPLHERPFSNFLFEFGKYNLSKRLENIKKNRL